MESHRLNPRLFPAPTALEAWEQYGEWDELAGDAAYLATLDPEEPHSAFSEALGAYCWTRDPGAVLALLNANPAVDPNLFDSHGNPPLHMACWAGSHECARLLVERGADPLLPNRAGELPLEWAASSAYPDSGDVCLFLIDQGASLEEVDNEGLTPFLRACQSRSPSAARALEGRGANLDAVSAGGQNAFDLACAFSYMRNPHAMDPPAFAELLLLLRSEREAGQLLLATGGPASAQPRPRRL